MNDTTTTTQPDIDSTLPAIDRYESGLPVTSEEAEAVEALDEDGASRKARKAALRAAKKAAPAKAKKAGKAAKPETSAAKPPRLSLEQSVGRQSVACLTSRRSKDEGVRSALTDAKRLEKTGTLAETKLRKLRDVLRELTPEEGDWLVLFQRARRGIGMVIAKQAE